MVLMRSCRPSSPSWSIFWGVLATLKSGSVALLTPASVAWADRTTATSSVKGLAYASSPLGSGLAAAKRRKISAARSRDGFFPLRAGVRLPAVALGRGRRVLGIGASRGPITLLGSSHDR